MQQTHEIHMKIQRNLEWSKTTLEKKKVEGLALSNFKTNYETKIRQCGIGGKTDTCILFRMISGTE